MGVPSLYRWLCKTVPNLSRKAKEQFDIDLTRNNPNGREFDNLYIDVNGLIHSSIDKQTIEEVIEHIQNQLMRIIMIVRPRNLLYIAIDGVCPIAKMIQQRKRRFTTDCLEGNAITPGTELMEKISVGIESFILNQMNNKGLDYWRRIKVIVSGVHVPGEGEHKIIEYIRSQERINESHVIYGEDADLLLLSLVLHYDSIFILRKDTRQIFDKNKKGSKPARNGTGKSKVMKDKIKKVENEKIEKEKKELKKVFGSDDDEFLIPFEFANISLISKKLLELSSQYENSIERLELENDFIYLMSIAGNDFLPNIEGIDIYAGALNTVLNIYFQLHSKGIKITENGKVNNNGVLAFFTELAQHEQRLIESQMKTRRGSAQPICGFINIDTNKIIKLGQSGYKERYVQTYFMNKEEYIKDSVKSYLEGMNWVFNYYCGNAFSWKWGYKCHYAPLLCHFVDYFQPVEFTTIAEDDGPIHPIEQLIAVLPPKSIHLIPKQLQEIYNLPEFKKTIPEQVIIDAHGQDVSYKGIALVGFPDISLIHQYVESHIKELNKLEVIRNQLSQEVLFVYNKIPNFSTIIQPTTIDIKHNEIKGILKEMKYSLHSFYYPVQHGVTKELQNDLIFGYYFIHSLQ
ncbi:5'-3' exonuclease domain containing protein [Entamoeba histolytica HM-1:IMSS-B]|uniref:5'-3' exonuclease domain containing protein n=5 Tax=Entamoeba histolytica TaxID=5759 RepID=C4M8Y2_ENTH1|nr:5'-3' exonuclease domain containing protein [Entamoeba histolytica HM-1:IMSS]EMD44867.1 5'3' exonuclease domain containing protein [Entamoeba histolytica KU27]EMH75823.1 5'-3' exonuclease domain containing protein [Entamoeba histolytica HM-1:IMSS-B]ENY64017.1 5'-3' exonuclease domain containing protein [Entamoeba histolytica HM-1:IMSS-A]GAT98085.1 5-3 exonuclease domain containing protein [Entamoeba histolytica]EAL44135.1 5'-3' exonuclease domain containing protein [Entamoeba histolytica HM|eukprot:XP_649521.1 5'-3' exonuclease domain containing protein [Entamoeba histolytica HM-1:IMSS]